MEWIKKKIKNLFKKLKIITVKLGIKIKLSISKTNVSFTTNYNIITIFLITLNYYNYYIICVKSVWHLLKNNIEKIFNEDFYNKIDELFIELGLIRIFIILMFIYVLTCISIIFYYKLKRSFALHIVPKIYVRYVLNSIGVSDAISNSKFFNIQFLYRVVTFPFFEINKINQDFFVKRMDFEEHKIIWTRLEEYIIILSDHYSKIKKDDIIEKYIIVNQLLIVRNMIFGFDSIFRGSYNSVWVKKNLLFIKKYCLMEKISDFFDKSHEYNDKLASKYTFSYFLLSCLKFLNKKIDLLNFNTKKDINNILVNNYNINLNTFKNINDLDYNKIYYLKIAIIDIVSKSKNEEEILLELIEFINYILNLLVDLTKICLKINEIELVQEYFFYGIDFIIKNELNDFRTKSEKYFWENKKLQKIDYNKWYEISLEFLVKKYAIIYNFFIYVYSNISILKHIWYYWNKLQIKQICFNIYLFSKNNIKVILIKFNTFWNYPFFKF